MPLDVITVDYGKQESIFEKLNPFVDKLVTAYKQKQINEWDNEIMTAVLADIDKPSQQEAIDAAMQKLNSPPPGLDEKGATDFAKKALGSMTLHEQMMGVAPPPGDTEMGPVQQKEVMTGGLQKPSAPAVGTPTTQEQQPIQGQQQETQLMPDKMEWDTLYKFVREQNVPIGGSWENTLAVLNQQLESGRKMTALGKNVFDMLLGEKTQEPSQREQLQQDVEFTNYLQQTLYPKSEQVDPIAQAWDRAGTLPQEMRADYLRQQGIDIPEGDKLDYDALNSFMKDNNMKVKTSTVNDKNEQSFVLEPIEEEYDLNDIVSMIKEAKSIGIDLKYTKDGLTVGAASTTSGKPSSDYERWVQDPERFTEYKKTIAEIGGTKDTTKPTKIDDILFGDTGIINKFIKEETIDQGIPLTKEDKDLIVSNYKIKKPTLTAEEIAEIERYFKQIGIDPNAEKQEYTEEELPEEKSGVNINPLSWTVDEYGFRKGQIKHDEEGNAWTYIGEGKWEKWEK